MKNTGSSHAFFPALPEKCFSIIRMQKKMTLFSWRGSIPAMLGYQIISKAFLLVFRWLFHQLSGLLFWKLNRSAFTSGDLPYLLRSWEGWILVLIGLAILFLYTAIDINATILLSRKILTQEKFSIRKLLNEALLETRRFLNPRGILIVLYVSLLAPLAGATFSVSLTSDFTMPDFIMSVINSRIILKVLYEAGMIALLYLGFINLYTFHFILFRKENPKTAMAHASVLMKQHWKEFLKKYLFFILKALLIVIAIVFLAYILPVGMIHAYVTDLTKTRILLIFFSLVLLILLGLYVALFLQFQMMELTVLFDEFTEIETSYTVPKRKLHVWAGLGACAVLAACLLLSAAGGYLFDLVFPAFSDVKVVAHRAGGTLGNENTTLALEKAVENNAYAGEIDVQRTKDGYYIINHDTTFQRLCGDGRTPQEMTLEEIKQLSVRNTENPLEPSVPVSTLEEMLDAADGKIHLFLELKGDTADAQMAEDVYQMAKEKNMLDQCTFISLKYELINDLETKHPDADTGYLCYFSFGDIADLNCDALMLEEESATSNNVEKIHEAGKEVYVWTVNSMDSAMHFMASRVDGIITDEVLQAEAVRSLMQNRSDEMRIMQALMQ